ncbi:MULTISPECIES: hypothetical protein [Sinorhizobium/Ensifer group]|uniref:Uncharacterized protein n=1 Tax=Sinorhizobium alkalisoli TaxID=1752398 RepID=A0A1E3V9M7_9HYPH|nr:MULTISPECIES: hypothetical protein [Sinorhizobium/Ensifer group]MCA1489334.1 hypothetical protein [Ensifer sp. NBAIM29]MCG5477598.1 hypothetical protein [Sinorhizobium alkalisoli]ODR89821.1 hypothetical protein A8M32_16670 [Sinorhizobium alkalisoli]OHV85826.1 hypothetical protein LCM4579_00195 [Ensifer sp. LCM 4579]QFI65082.1 hypothetical protein EKH55_0208 [Sinorhizobium alkalisoli]
MTEFYADKIEIALQTYVNDHQGSLTREQAISAILENWFASHGYLPPQQEGLRPEELDASNDD